jgi:hypothetical protein
VLELELGRSFDFVLFLLTFAYVGWRLSFFRTGETKRHAVHIFLIFFKVMFSLMVWRVGRVAGCCIDVPCYCACWRDGEVWS